MEALRKKLLINTRVIRDDAWQVISARELVPGDIVRLRPGDFVPADVKIVTGALSVDQSALTGESMAIEKKGDDVLCSGSILRQGEANGVVILTGAATYYGRTTELVQMARPKLHMEEVIAKVVRVLVVIVVALLAIAFAVSVWRGVNLLEILPLMMVLLLSAVPVALPVMFTVSMTVGSMELARKGVLVTRLSASEDAATMNVPCVDKTGTITMNRLSMASVIPLNGFTEDDVLVYGALASQEANQDPIDLGFLAAAKKKDLVLGSYAVSEFIPFDAKTRRTVFKASFVVLIYLLTGKFVISAPGMILGVLMAAESIGLFFIGSRYLGLSADLQALNTFGFEIMIYFAIFPLFARPSWLLIGVLLLDAVIAAFLATLGIPGMKAVPLTTTLIVIAYSFVFSLFVDDMVKFVMVRKMGVRWQGPGTHGLHLAGKSFLSSTRKATSPPIETTVFCR